MLEKNIYQTNITDCHTHILPGIDDGSSDIGETEELLKAELGMQVKKIVFTPHFYAHRISVEKFIKKRQEAFEQVLDLIKKDELSDFSENDFILGGEIYFFPGISKAQELDKLCFNEGEFILIEMPFAQWDMEIIKEIKNLINDRKKKVIIAHIERFATFQKDKKAYNELLKLPVIFQINAEGFLEGFFNKRWCHKFINEHDNVILGSDCHNTKNRVPNLDEALKAIEKKHGREKIEEILKNAERLFE